jgi:phosphoserine phosphatase
MAISTQADLAAHGAKDADASQLPLCVDLDGTLISSDLLLESLLRLIRSKPWCLFLAPLWMLRGRAAFKAAVAARIELQPTALPYNEALIAWLEQQRRSGRSLWLCTAANESVALRIAEHLGMFHGVLASNSHLNLSGKNKAAQLVQRFGHRGFDYCGNEHLDLHIWKCARGAILVGDRGALEKEAAKCSTVLQRFPPVLPPRLAAWRALRAQRWFKNILVLLPLFVIDVPDQAAGVVNATLAVISFCLCASSAYILNDLLDLDADRADSGKATRPFAAGDLSIIAGVAIAATLLLASQTIAWFLPIEAVFALVAYFILAVVYSWILKPRVLLRELALATLNTLRPVAGAAAIGAPMSMSTVTLCLAVFLGLRLAQR